MTLFGRLRALFTKRARMYRQTTGTRMDPTFIADLKAEAERNAGNPYTRPVPDYCDVAWNEPDRNHSLTLRQRGALKAVK